jgi:hypothetical protein
VLLLVFKLISSYIGIIGLTNLGYIDCFKTGIARIAITSIIL